MDKLINSTYLHIIISYILVDKYFIFTNLYYILQTYRCLIYISCLLCIKLGLGVNDFLCIFEAS